MFSRIKSRLVSLLCGAMQTYALPSQAKYHSVFHHSGFYHSVFHYSVFHYSVFHYSVFLGVWILVFPLMGVCSSRLIAQTPNQSLLPQQPAPLTPDPIPPALQQLLQETQQSESISATSPSQIGLTIPSLWWIEDQFGQKTVLNWKAYPSLNRQEQQVHVYLRSNLWTRFSYFERYAFVTHFSHLTRTYGYQLVMLESNGSPLASYLCDFNQLDPQSIQGTQDSQQQLIQAYPLPKQSELACDLWLNPAFPRNVL